MKTRNFILFVLTAVVCGAFLCADSQAKVCFLGEDCGAGGNFSDTSGIKPDEMCIDEGYTLKSDCLATPNKQIAGYCPYSSKYVTCCGLEYAYSKCSYPLVSDGVCGNKHKCICDSGEYPYYQKSATVCSKITGTPEYLNSYASGGSCAYADYSSGSLKSKIQFSQCSCDRGLYPKSEEECNTINAGTTGASCTDSEGNTYYAACLCGEEFRVITTDCEYGTYSGEPLCQQGDVYKAKRCCTCSDGTYPYDSNNLPAEVLTTSSCETITGCTRGGSKVKATSCATGYKVQNGKCVPIPCEDAVKLFIKKNTNYVLFNGSKLVDGNGNTVSSGSGKTALVAKNISVAQGAATQNTQTYNNYYCIRAQCIPSSAQRTCMHYAEDLTGITCGNNGMGIYSAGDISTKAQINPDIPGNDKYFCCTDTSSKSTTTTTHSGLAKTNVFTYYSAAYIASSLGNSTEAKAVQRSCTVAPKITYTGTYFPYDVVSGDTSTPPTLNFYGINLSFSTSTITRPVNIYNGSVSISSKLTANGVLKLERKAGYHNADDLEVYSGYGTFAINKKFTSTGYDYDVYNLDVTTNTSTPVVFIGKSNSNRNVFNIDNLAVDGISLIKYYNAEVKKAEIGCDATADIWNTSVRLDYTDWVMFKGDSNYSVHLNRRATLGGISGWYALDSSSKIRFRSDILANVLTVRRSQYNGEDNNRCTEYYSPMPGISSSGTTESWNSTGRTSFKCVGNGHNSSCESRDYTWYGDKTSDLSSKNCDAKGCNACAWYNSSTGITEIP